MKLTYQELQDGLPHFQELVNHKGLAANLKLRLAALGKEVKAKLSTLEEQRQELIAKHDRDGELDLNRNDTPELRRAQREFRKDWQAILQEHVWLPYKQIPYEAICGLLEPQDKKNADPHRQPLSAGDIMNLGWCIARPEPQADWLEDEEDAPEQARAASGD